MKIAALGALQGTVASSLTRDAGAAKPVLLCLSHLRWDFVFQRPQHLLTRAARDHTVLFFEEPVFHPGIAPSLLRRSAGKGVPDGITVLVPQLPEGMAPAEATVALRGLLDQTLASEGMGTGADEGRPLILWFYTPMAFEFASHLKADLTVYDCMDELSAFRSAPPRMLELERALMERAELVFTGGRSLFEAKRHRHARAFCFPSSIDTAHFRAARSPQPEPDDQAGIARKRVGFFGVIDERMDLGLVAALAEARPDLQFVMIGPVVKIDPGSLPRHANIHWLGGRKYADLPRYMAGWDAGFMPFARNESTRFISPTKTPEFLAAGLPVVSTAITDVIRDWGEEGFVDIADDAAGFALALDRLLAQPREAWLARVDRKLVQQSWDRTWSDMRGLIQAALPSKVQPGASAQAAASLLAGARPATSSRIATRTTGTATAPATASRSANHA